MTALISYGYRMTAFNVPPTVAIVADETHMQYLVSFGSDKEYQMRAGAIAKAHEGTLHSADDWLRVGTSNFAYVRFTEPISVEDFDAGVAQVRTFLDLEDTPKEQDR